MPRSAASPSVRGVRPVRGGVSGLLKDTVPGRPPSSPASKNRKGALMDALNSNRCERRLFDLRLAELNVLLGDRIVFLLHKLVGHRARVLARHVIEAGVGARYELHFDGGGLGHC